MNFVRVPRRKEPITTAGQYAAIRIISVRCRCVRITYHLRVYEIHRGSVAVCYRNVERRDGIVEASDNTYVLRHGSVFPNECIVVLLYLDLTLRFG